MWRKHRGDSEHNGLSLLRGIYFLSSAIRNLTKFPRLTTLLCQKLIASVGAPFHKAWSNCRRGRQTLPRDGSWLEMPSLRSIEKVNCQTETFYLNISIPIGLHNRVIVVGFPWIDFSHSGHWIARVRLPFYEVAPKILLNQSVSFDWKHPPAVEIEWWLDDLPWFMTNWIHNMTHHQVEKVRWRPPAISTPFWRRNHRYVFALRYFRVNRSVTGPKRSKTAICCRVLNKDVT